MGSEATKPLPKAGVWGWVKSANGAEAPRKRRRSRLFVNYFFDVTEKISVPLPKAGVWGWVKSANGAAGDEETLRSEITINKR